MNLSEKIWHVYLRQPYRLHVIDEGGDGPVMIFIHGLASSSDNWEYVVPPLRAEYRCISIDLLGFGDSPKPQWYDYTIEDHLAAVHAAIRRMHLHGPFTLVGHSLGSLLATRYARIHGKRISRLVLLSPPVYAPLYTIASRSARQRTSLYLKAYRFIRTHKRITPETITRLSRIIPQIKFLILRHDTWIPFIRSLEHCIEQQTLIDDIRHVAAPTDVFYGLFDEVIVPYNVRQLAKIRDVNLYQLRVSHAVGKRYAAAVVRVLSHPPKPLY